MKLMWVKMKMMSFLKITWTIAFKYYVIFTVHHRVDITSVTWLEDPLKRCSSSTEVWNFQVVAATVKGPELSLELVASRLRRPRATGIDDRNFGVENSETDSGLVVSQVLWSLEWTAVWPEVRIKVAQIFLTMPKKEE